MTTSVFGTIQVSANAVDFQTKGDFDIVLQGEVRTAIVGKDGKIHGFTVENMPGSIEGTITATEDMDLAALFDMTDANVQLDFKGFPWQVIVSGATYTGPRTLGTAEAEIAVKFTGDVTILKN